MPQGIVEGSSGSAGSASTASRADHVHAVPSSFTPKAHATTHKSGQSDALALNEFAVPSGAVNFNGKEATGLCLDNQASDPAAVLGKIYFKTGDTHPYICTAT